MSGKKVKAIPVIVSLTKVNKQKKKAKVIDTDELDAYNEERLVSKFDKENIKGKK